MATAKARLHQLCVQRLNGDAPIYATLPAEGGKGGFVSTVALPNGATYALTAACVSKKLAEQGAAQAALDAGVCTSQSAAGPHFPPMEQLQQWLQQQLSLEVLSQAGYMRTTAALALRFNDSRIPLTALLTKKALDTCCAVDAECRRDICRAVAVLQHAVRDVQSHTATHTSLQLTQDGLHVDMSLPEPLRTELWQMAGESIQAWRAYEHTNGQHNNKRVSSLEVYSVAVLPANIEHDVHDMLLPVEAYYFSSMAKALNATTVLQSQRVGTSASDCHFYVPMNNVGSTETDSLPLNTRASALLRRPVYGDAILAEAGPSYKGNLNCGIRYKNVTARTFHKLVLLTTPDGMYRSSRRALYLSRLSRSFRGRTRWRGPLPRVLLEELCAQRGWPTPTYTWRGKDWRGHALCTSEDEHNICTRPPAMFEASVNLSSIPKQSFASSRAFKLLKDAQNSAALTALWAIASLDDKKNESVKLSPAVNEAKRRRIDEANASLVSRAAVVEGGHGATPEVDAIVCVDYCLAEGGNNTSKGTFLQEGQTPLEQHESFEFELGGGGVHAQLDSIVSHMQEGETIRAPLAMADDLDGSSESDLRYVVCQVTLRSWTKPAEDRMEDQIFFPSLATQRMEFVGTIVKAMHAECVVDLGCGEGKLLTSLWRHTEVKRLIGVDISNSALERFAMFCKHKLIPNTSTTTDQHADRCIETYAGSVADCDAGLVDTCTRDVDVVTMIEVIEHLDPEPLQAVGTNILKNYAPRIAIVSTPNVEYNPLLDQACTHTHNVRGGEDASSSGVRLRNEDHRFEWSRAEFEQWARPLARAYGYRVRFSGVGVLLQGEEKKLGFTTQIAIFQRIDDSKRQESRRNVYTLYDTFRTSGSAQVHQ